MINNVGDNRMESKPRSLFLIIYSTVFTLTVAVLILLVSNERDRSCYESSQRFINSAEVLLQVLELQLEKCDVKEVHGVIQAYNASVAVLMKDAAEEIAEAGRDVPGLQFKKVNQISVPSSMLSTGDSFAYKSVLSEYKKEFDGLSQMIQLKYQGAAERSSILFLIFIVFSISTLGSVPVVYYIGHWAPISHYINTLALMEQGNDNKIKPGRTGIVKRLGIKLSSLQERQQISTRLIENISEGKFDNSINGVSNDGFLHSLQSMQNKLKTLYTDEQNNTWVNECLARLELILKTRSGTGDWGREVITLLSKSISSGLGVMYGFEDLPEDAHFFVYSSYGATGKDFAGRKISAGEGQLGQVVLEKKLVVLENLPTNFLVINSGLGESCARQIVIVPLLFKGSLYGALEFGLFSPVKEHELKWLVKAAESLAAHLFNERTHAAAKLQLQELANKQAQELVEIHRLQQHTYNKLEKKLQEVEEEKSKNQAILEGCVDGVLTFDGNGSLHFCNKAAAEIFNSSADELVKRRITELLHVRIDEEKEAVKCFFLTDSGEKEIGIRTEASINVDGSGQVDVLITSTQVQMQNTIFFTFFIQKISVDLF